MSIELASLNFQTLIDKAGELIMAKLMRGEFRTGVSEAVEIVTRWTEQQRKATPAGRAELPDLEHGNTFPAIQDGMCVSRHPYYITLDSGVRVVAYAIKGELRDGDVHMGAAFSENFWQVSDPYFSSTSAHRCSGRNFFYPNQIVSYIPLPRA